MSYCRFSCDNWKSDVYVYESNEGFVVHVAANRITSPIPPMMPYDSELHDEWFESHQRQMTAVREATHEDIGGEHDGEQYVYGSRRELIDGLNHLSSCGYHVPDWVIPTIQDEIEEGDE